MTNPTLKLACLAAVGFSLIGCASRPARVENPPEVRSRTRPPAPAAAALAFAPQVADEELDLSREGRNTVAYAGYEQQVLSVTYTRQDDRQRWGRFGSDQSQFERRSVSTTVTVRGR